MKERKSKTNKNMRIYLITLIIAVVATNALQAQHLNIGIKGGLNMYNVVNENNNYGDPIAGFHIGLVSHFHLNDQFALQPELVFSTQGSNNTNDGLNSKLNLNYINVPVSLQYMFDNGFRLFAGPQLSFLVGAKSYSNNTELDRTDDFNGIDFGAVLGMSYINPNSNLGIDVRYNLGLSEINETSTVSIYNRGIQLGLFYLFNHK